MPKFRPQKTATLLEHDYLIFQTRLEAAYALYCLRTKARLSRKTLAQKIGASEIEVIEWEEANTSPTVDTLARVAQVLQKRLRVTFE